MAAKILPFDESIAQSLFDSIKEFPVDLDDAWKWIGYAKKQNALEFLSSVFEEDVDFIRFTPEREIDGQGFSGLSPQQKANIARRHKIYLTVDCFKQLGMMAQTENGKKIRRYFLDCEKRAKAIGNRRLSDAEIARLCILSQPTVHTTRFEEVYYDRLSRLTGLKADGHKRPRRWAQLTKEFVYDCLPKGVTEALYQCRKEHGGWDKLHQYLSDDGLELFRKHMEEILRMMSYADSINDLRRMMRNKLVDHYQYRLFDDCRKDGVLTITRDLKQA